MTRKQYDVDDPHGEEWEEEKRRMKELEQKLYEEMLKKEMEKNEIFAMKHFTELQDMWDDIHENKINIYILYFGKCKFKHFADFIEHPLNFSNLELNYGRCVWIEENKPELKSHFKALSRSVLFYDQEVKLEQFMNFCYDHSLID